MTQTPTDAVNPNLIEWATHLLRHRMRVSFYTEAEVARTVKDRRAKWDKMSVPVLSGKLLEEMGFEDFTGPH